MYVGTRAPQPLSKDFVEFLVQNVGQEKEKEKKKSVSNKMVPAARSYSHNKCVKLAEQRKWRPRLRRLCQSIKMRASHRSRSNRFKRLGYSGLCVGKNGAANGFS